MCRILSTLRSVPELSATTLAMVYGMPPSTLTNAMRDRIQLSSETEAELHTLAIRAAQVLEALRPLAIPKGDWQTLKAICDSQLNEEDIRARVSALVNVCEPSSATQAANSGATSRTILGGHGDDDDGIFGKVSRV